MTNPLNSYYKDTYNLNISNLNSSQVNSLEEILNKFFFEKLPLESLDSALSGRTLEELHKIVSLMFSEDQQFYKENMFISRNPEDVQNRHNFLKLIQKKAIQYLYQCRLQNPNCILNSSLEVNEFIKLFYNAQLWSTCQIGYPINHDLYLNPVSLMLHLPDSLMCELNPDALEESLKEILKSKQKSICSFEDNISENFRITLLNRFNAGSLEGYTCTFPELTWIHQQPLFQKMKLENMRSDPSLSLDTIANASQKKMYEVLSHLQFFERENNNSKNLDPFAFKIIYILELAIAFEKANRDDVFVSALKQHISDNKFKINNIVFGNFCYYIDAFFKTGNICVDITKYAEKIDVLLRIFNSDMDDIPLLVPSKDLLPLLSQLSSTYNILKIERSPNHVFSSNDVNRILKASSELKNLSLPFELIPSDYSVNLPPNQGINFDISVSLQTLKLGRGELLKKIYLLNHLPCFSVQINLEGKNEKLNVERLFTFINQLTHPWYFNIQEDDIDWRNFYNLYLKIDEFDSPTQIKLLELPQKYPKSANYASQEVKDYILNHIMASDLDKYPDLPKNFYFSEAIESNLKQLKTILNNISIRLPKLMHYHIIIERILIAAYKLQGNGEKELSLEFLNQIAQKFLEALEAHNVKNNINESSPELFKLIINNEFFNNNIPKFSDLAKKAIINFFPSSVEDPQFKLWANLFRLVIKYQLLQHDADFQEKIKNLLSIDQIKISAIFKIIDTTPAEGQEKLVKSLQFVMDPLNKWLLNSADFSEINRLEYKKYINLFLKTGWAPPLDKCYTEHFYFPYLLIDSICDALPHLNSAQKKWVAEIVPKIAHRYPLSDEDQMKYMDLFKYHCINKQRGFVPFGNEIFLDTYPVIFNQMVDCYTKEMSNNPNYLDLGIQLAAIILSQLYVDDVSATKAITLVSKVFKLLKEFNSPEKNKFILNRIKDSPSLARFFTLSYTISKDGTPKKILPCAVWFLQALFPKLLYQSEEVRHLMVHAMLELKETKLLSNEEFRPTIRQHCVNIIQKRGWKRVSPVVIEILIDSLNYRIKMYQRYNQYFNDYVALGKMIIEVIIQSDGELKESMAKLEQMGGWMEPSMITPLMDSPEFVKSIFSNQQSILKFFKLFSGLDTMDQKTMKVVFRAWKTLYPENEIKLFSVKNNNFVQHQLRHLAKHPERYFEKIESIKKEILFSLKTIVECNIPAEILSNTLHALWENVDPATLFWLNCYFPKDIKTLIKRDLNSEEEKFLSLSSIPLNPEHISSVRSLIQKPQLPLEGNHTNVELHELIRIFDEINFEYPSFKGYCNPKELLIDKKVVDIKLFRGFIYTLIDNVMNNKKITAAPDNEMVRKKFYDEICNQLKHITYILLQKEPHQCIAYLQTIGEIGSKCATQYQELAPLAYCLIQETDKVLIPYSIKGASLKDSPKDLLKYLSKRYLFPNHYKLLLSSIDPLIAKEITTSSGIQATLNEIPIFSADLEAKANELYEKGSLLWLLAYLFEHGFQNRHITNRLSSLICGILIGQDQEYSHTIKKIINLCYKFDEQRIKSFLEEFVQFYEGADLKLHLEKMEAKANEKSGLIQPNDLKYQLLIHLHEQRWNYFRTAMAKLPDVIESSVHSYKYIVNKLSPIMGIYEGYENTVKFEDKHVLNEAKLAAENIKYSFYSDYHTAFVVKYVQEFLKTKVADLVDWFKVNTPPEKNPATFMHEIYDEDYVNIKEEWILYMLNKMGIIKLPSMSQTSSQESNNCQVQ